MNECVLMGRLTAEPDIRSVGEHKVAKMTVALDEGRNSSGEKMTTFVDVEAWNKTAELIEKYVGKGNRILINGSLRKSTWEKDGQKMSKLFVNANRIEFVDFKESEKTEQQEKSSEIGSIGKEDIPF